MSTSARYSSQLVAVVLAARLVYGQKIDFSFGGRVGFNVNQGNADRTFLGSNIDVYRHDSQRYSFGPTVEVGFLKRFAVEFSPLFRRDGVTRFTDYSAAPLQNLPPGSVQVATQFVRERRNIWELPVVGKYYFAGKEAKFRPFIGAGGFATYYGRTTEVTTSNLTSSGARQSINQKTSGTQWGRGPVGTIGVNIRAGKAVIVPEFRYTRDIQNPYSGERNRAEFFIGLRF
jgi:hypothetical protein